MSEIISQIDYDNLKAIKHRSDLTTGDIVYLCIDWQKEEKIYTNVICTGYCGKDEFWGESLSGEKFSWCDNDLFKIIGKNINL